MKFSAILLATLAVSAQAITRDEYEESDRYPFVSPYSTSELAAHDNELKNTLSPKKQSVVQKHEKPAKKAEKKQEPKKEVKKQTQKKPESIEEREYNLDIDQPSHNQGRLFEIMNSSLEN